MLNCRPLLILAILVFSSALRADFLDQVITFETRPDGSGPQDNQNLVNTYSLDGGGSVRFFVDRNGNNNWDGDDVDAYMAIEAVGDDNENGFVNSQLNLPDTANPGYEDRLGSWFLRQPNNGGAGLRTNPFIVDYDSPLSIVACSFEIWDIDGTGPNSSEQWKIEALDAANNVVSTILTDEYTTSGPFSLNGRPWVAKLEFSKGIDKLRITFVGTKDGTNQGEFVGLAFNNFYPTAVPEVGSLALGFVAALSMVVVSLFKYRRKSSHSAAISYPLDSKIDCGPRSH